MLFNTSHPAMGKANRDQGFNRFIGPGPQDDTSRTDAIEFRVRKKQSNSKLSIPAWVKDKTPLLSVDAIKLLRIKRTSLSDVEFLAFVDSEIHGHAFLEKADLESADNGETLKHPFRYVSNCHQEMMAWMSLDWDLVIGCQYYLTDVEILEKLSQTQCRIIVWEGSLGKITEVKNLYSRILDNEGQSGIYIFRAHDAPEYWSMHMKWLLGYRREEFWSGTKFVCSLATGSYNISHNARNNIESLLFFDNLYEVGLRWPNTEEGSRAAIEEQILKIHSDHEELLQRSTRWDLYLKEINL